MNAVNVVFIIMVQKKERWCINNVCVLIRKFIILENFRTCNRYDDEDEVIENKFLESIQHEL